MKIEDITSRLGARPYEVVTSSNLVALAAKHAHPGTDLKLAPGAVIWTRPDPTSSGQAHLVVVWPEEEIAILSRANRDVAMLEGKVELHGELLILNANGLRYDLTVGQVV